MLFDYVGAPLTCPACGEVAEDPLELDLQTKIADQPGMNILHLGDNVRLVADPRQRDYLLLNEHWRPGAARLRVIQSWSCPHCAANPLWARLTFDNGRLISVEAVPLDAEHLSDADFITHEVLVLVPLDSVPRFQKMTPHELRTELGEIGKARGK